MGQISRIPTLKFHFVCFLLRIRGLICAHSDRFLPDKAIDLIDEAGSRVRLRHAQLPEEARELEKELRQITKEKNEAICGQDFGKNNWTHISESSLVAKNGERVQAA
ncbi:putative clpA/ClpB, AAA lid domain-containing protein [Helianthus annuus]|uniref:ATP-dependent Clp protease ATP-binding subunit ClpA homolog CD4A, chloroplastic-like n=1 Tax=Helianthus annuus TaxID=4232 RepID=UPI00165339B0|nr:ATP-dependent Clp protease ATP-binding subunit ClpA homolog CD4A, chloroplastic-like [Helianthus annuus]KAJ0495663.1 putative clpA/ClpB, AAA lid domain-containing protein [Helianthus annuus]